MGCRFKRLGPKHNEKGIITVETRISSCLKDNWNINEFIIISREHPFSISLIEQAHKVDQWGIENTFAKLQSKYWIPRARKLIKTIEEKCTVCRKQDKCLNMQTVGQLPAERLAPSPYFYT